MVGLALVKTSKRDTFLGSPSPSSRHQKITCCSKKHLERVWFTCLFVRGIENSAFSGPKPMSPPKGCDCKPSPRCRVLGHCEPYTRHILSCCPVQKLHFKPKLDLSSESTPQMTMVSLAGPRSALETHLVDNPTTADIQVVIRDISGANESIQDALVVRQIAWVVRNVANQPILQRQLIDTVICLVTVLIRRSRYDRDTDRQPSETACTSWSYIG